MTYWCGVFGWAGFRIDMFSFAVFSVQSFNLHSLQVNGNASAEAGRPSKGVRWINPEHGTKCAQFCSAAVLRAKSLTDPLNENRVRNSRLEAFFFTVSCSLEVPLPCFLNPSLSNPSLHQHLLHTSYVRMHLAVFSSAYLDPASRRCAG